MNAEQLDIFTQPVDRFYLLGMYTRGLRDYPYNSTTSITQEELARKAGVTQGFISNLENIGSTGNVGKRAVNRRRLIETIIWGLEVDDRSIVDTATYLFDGRILNPEEIRRYMRTQPAISDLNSDQARELVLGQFNRLTDRIHQIDIGNNISTFQGSIGHPLKYLLDVANLSQEAGMLYSVKELPDFLKTSGELRDKLAAGIQQNGAYEILNGYGLVNFKWQHPSEFKEWLDFVRSCDSYHFLPSLTTPKREASFKIDRKVVYRLLNTDTDTTWIVGRNSLATLPAFMKFVHLWYQLPKISNLALDYLLN